MRWKSERNINEIQETVDNLVEKYDCKTDEEKTIVLLNWFERYSGNMFNNWGWPTLYTGFVHPLCLSFGDGHAYFLLFCNLYIRPLNRDYPTWVFTTRSGRCEEHSILFREMARAAGLKVRSVVGKDLDHLWAEVKINGTWITVDPSNVVHNKIWLDKNFTGYNLSRKCFISRFTKRDVPLIFAEYPNGTKVPVTDRYLNNTKAVNITVVDENNKPMENIEVSFFSGSGLFATDYEYRLKTDENGKCKIKLGKGTISFRAHTDGFIYLSGEKLEVLDGNKAPEVVIVLKKNFSNVYIGLLFISFLILLSIMLFRRKIKLWIVKKNEIYCGMIK